ncbi:MAG: OsmC family protein [Acidobacteriaceae bacterium]
MNATAVWRGEERFEIQSGGGRTVMLDGSAEHTAGPSPMQMVLGALCACTSVDVVSILQKKREPLEGLTVTATAERASGPPRVFTGIHLTYRIRGPVSKKGAEDAVSLSKNKYCSVSKMLEKAATIDYSIEYES